MFHLEFDDHIFIISRFVAVLIFGLKFLLEVFFSINTYELPEKKFGLYL